MKVRAALIDFDGVIYDSWQPAWEILCQIARELTLPSLNIPSVSEKLRKTWGLPGKLVMSVVFPGQDPNEIMKKWREIEKEQVKKGLPLIPGAKESLAHLKSRGIIHGLITNRSEALFPEIQKSGILDYFDFIQTCGKISGENRIHPIHIISPYFKPQPGVFNASLEYLAKSGIEAKEVIYIEDSLIVHPDYPTTKETAEQKGITFLPVCSGPINTISEWVLWGEVPKKNILGSIADLPAWIEKHGMGGE